MDLEAVESSCQGQNKRSTCCLEVGFGGSVLKITTDGGCRSNPGPGAWAFVIHREDGSTEGKAGFLPMGTVNTFEYRAVTAACIYLNTLFDLEDCEFWSDSQLIVNQLNGTWAVKDKTLSKYYQEAITAFEMLRQRVPVSIQWFRRENNKEADLLCNRIQDRHGVVCNRKGKKAQNVY
jgi:ribonuclease HI